jgi:hypothetical protein
MYYLEISRKYKEKTAYFIFFFIKKVVKTEKIVGFYEE